MPLAIGNFKVCAKCKKKKHVKNFSKRNRASDGLDYRCKQCNKKVCDSNRIRMRELDRQSYYRNQEKRIAKSKKYNHLLRGTPIPDEVLEILSHKRIPRSHEDAVQHERERHRQYRQTVYREKHNKFNREYAKTKHGKEVCRQKWLRRRARENNLRFDFSNDDYDILMLIQNKRCAKCKKRFSSKLKAEVDHIVPVIQGGEFTLNNTQLLCRSCNASKGTQTVQYRPDIPNLFR